MVFYSSSSRLEDGLNKASFAPSFRVSGLQVLIWKKLSKRLEATDPRVSAEAFPSLRYSKLTGPLPRHQVEDPTSAPKPNSYVMFTVQDQLSRVAQWVETTFLCGRKVAGDR